MKKQYTKKQIKEAISYWKNLLKTNNYINESTHKISRNDDNWVLLFKKFMNDYPDGKLIFKLDDKIVKFDGFTPKHNMKFFKLNTRANSGLKISIDMFFDMINRFGIKSALDITDKYNNSYSVDNNNSEGKLDEVDIITNMFVFKFKTTNVNVIL